MDISALLEFLTLSQYAITVADSDASWETKFNIIFSDDVSAKLIRMIQLEWCDPDESWQDDVMAFIEALRDKRSELEGIRKQLLANQYRR